MKTIWTTGAVLLTLLISVSACKQGEPNQVDSDIVSQQEAPDTVTYTAFGYTESYEAELTIFPSDSNIKSREDLPEFDILQIIPDPIDDNGIGEYMRDIYGEHFVLNGLFREHSGQVQIFYDKEKKYDAVTYTALKGKPDGKVLMYDLDGDILMERVYDNGKWIGSGKAPASSDWTYSITTSQLEINDLENGETNKDDSRIIELMPSMQENADYDEMIKPESFDQPFQVNGEAYTGKLLAHNRIPEGEDYLRFELNFKNGLLHGTQKVYEEFAGLVSEEEYNNGIIVPIILPVEPLPQVDPYIQPVEKPIIYFYPEETTDLTVILNFDGSLIHTYPKYNEQWNVTAHPDGTLFDAEGKEYYALYWEGQSDEEYTLNEGNVVKGENTVAFLESALKALGLNRREANEFIMYWLPRMENNAYNLIHFATDEYEAIAELNVDPAPETMIRVMMVFQPLKSSIDIPVQNLEALGKTRKGFTVVEWGGQEVLNEEDF